MTETMQRNDGRARALAHRLLSGAGSATMYAYRAATTIDVLAHGLTADGQLVVACHRPEGEASSVRLELTKAAPTIDASITAASAHLLGELEWLSGDQADDELPDLVAMASAAGCAVAVVRTSKVLLHDFSGVTPLDFSDAATEAAPTWLDEHAARDAVAVHGADLADLCWSVEMGLLPGETTTGPAPACPHTVGRTFFVDADSSGIVLMHVAERATLVARADFDHPASSLEEFAGAVNALVRRCSPIAA